MIFLKEGYNSAETTKVLHVSLLKVICVNPEFLKPPHDLAMWEKFKVELFMRKQFLEKKRTPENIAEECGVSVETIQPYIAKLLNSEKFDEFTEEYCFSIYTAPKIGQPTVFYHTADYLSAYYEYSDDYGHEISEDLKKAAAEDGGSLVQTVWDICIFECSWEPPGTSAKELANSISWELNVGGDVLTKILSAKFSSSFFTKCAILSDVIINHSDDDSFAELIEYNDIGLPLAQRINLVEKMSDLDEEDIDNLDYIDETWEQLCETLGVDKDGDYISLANMRAV